MINSWYRGRIIILFLAAVMVLPCCRKSPADGSLPSGNGGTPEQQQETVLTNVYRGVEFTVPEEYLTRSLSYTDSITPFVDPALGTVTVYMEDKSGAGHALTLSVDTGILSDEAVPIPEGQRLCAGIFTGEEFLYVTAEEERQQYGSANAVRVYAHRLNPQTGELTSSEDLRSLFTVTNDRGAALNISSLTADTDGDIWIGSGEEILILDSSYRKILSLSGPFNLPLTLAAAPDGTVWLPNKGKITIFDKRDPNNRNTSPTANEPEYIVFCDGFDFCYQSDSGVYGVTTENEEHREEILMDFVNSSVDPTKSTLVAAFSGDSLVFAEGSPAGFSLYRASDDIDVSSLIVLSVAVPFSLDRGGMGAEGFSTQIVEYNKAHPDRRVILNDYSIYNTEEDPDAGARKLMMDIVTGLYKPDIVMDRTARYPMEPPDTVMISEQLVSRGLYRDLSPFMENDPFLNRDTVFGAVQRLFATEDGGMWGIGANFSVETLIAPTALLGEYAGGWTLGQMLDCVKQAKQNEQYLMGGLTKENALSKTLGRDGISAFIDRDSATCSFDSAEFIEWLDFYASLPANEAELRGKGNGLDTQRSDNLELYYTNRVMLQYVNLLNGFSDLVDLESAFGTKDWTMVGYPAAGTNGTLIKCSTSVIMTSFCSETEIAWDLIRTLMTETTASRSCAFPALKERFRNTAAQEIEGGGYTIISFQNGRRKTGGWTDTGEYPTQKDLTSPGWVSVPTWEDYDRLADLFDNVLGYSHTESVPDTLSSIIKEELSAFGAGAGTAKSCAGNIQSRVSIWLAEHK